MRQSFEHIILGLDPGLGTTGWGVVRELTGGEVLYVASGSIAPPAKERLADRLLYIEEHLAKVLADYGPEHVVIEKAFAGVNIESAFLLGSARAACLLAAARLGLEIKEYAPTHIKKAITGSGRANKEQMSFMVKTLLPNSRPDSEHATDALAIALTDIFRNKKLNLQAAS